MKKFLCATMLVLFAAQICFAVPPPTLDRTAADSRARQSFNLRSVEGASYAVCIVGEDEKILSDWLWALDDKIFTGNYSAYIGKANSSTLALQNVELFGGFGGDNQRINVTRPNRDGFYSVEGVRGLPDLLVSMIQVTGGGYFEMKIFVVKDERLQSVKFLGDDKETRYDSFNTISKPTTYSDNGTLSVPWHTNAAPDAGSYVTVFRLDVENLILIPTHTNKTWSPR